MRQIYRSPRIENIERLVQLLAEQEIETSVSDHAVYQRPNYDRPSYFDSGDESTWIKLWITHTDDYPRAVDLLQKIGLEPCKASFFPEPLRNYVVTSRKRSDYLSRRLRLVLLLVITGIILFGALRIFGFG